MMYRVVLFRYNLLHQICNLFSSRVSYMVQVIVVGELVCYGGSKI
jgi:hypothetical protein